MPLSSLRSWAVKKARLVLRLPGILAFDIVDESGFPYCETFRQISTGRCLMWKRRTMFELFTSAAGIPIGKQLAGLAEVNDPSLDFTLHTLLIEGDCRIYTAPCVLLEASTRLPRWQHHSFHAPHSQHSTLSLAHTTWAIMPLVSARCERS